jgi:HEAT repeat protein
MGLFDFFKSSPEATIQKHAGRVADKRAQAPDRWESIQALGGLKSSEAVKALLPRFKFYVDPGITDNDEKDETFRLVCAAGKAAIPPTRAFALKAESLSWPLKILERLADDDEMVEVLVGLLAHMDVEYQRDPQRKLQALQAIEERRDPRVGAAVERFLGDVNETARFHAVTALFRQDDVATRRPAIEAALAGEESVRVKARLLECFAQQGWAVSSAEGGAAKDKIAKAMPPGWSLDAKGVPVKKG